MKQPILYLLILFSMTISNDSLSQKDKEITEYYCNIFFGGGFGRRTGSDSINLTVNGVNIYQNQGLYSLSYGSSPGRVLIIRLGKKLVACTTDDYPEKVIYLGRLKRKNTLKIDAVFKGEKYHFTVDLTKGRFLIFSHSYEGNLEYRQHVEIPYFE